MSYVENYLIINTTNNIVENIVVWSGSTETWTPPVGTILIKQATTPTKVWRLNESLPIPEYELAVDTEVTGGIGYTWDGTYLSTPESRPKYVTTVPTPSA